MMTIIYIDLSYMILEKFMRIIYTVKYTRVIKLIKEYLTFTL